MNKFKIVSLDMFQTLVDVNSRRHHVWKRILGEAYNEQFVEECWSEANKLVFGYFSKYVCEEKDFYSVKQVFEKCYRELFPLKGVNFDPCKGAKILADEHGYACPYEDSELFLESVRKHYTICLVSDTDRDMVQPLLETFNFNKVFLSEDFECYKFDPKGYIFNEVINYYKVNPEDIIHIGDGYSDVVGAKRVGIKTCWLNRHNVKWNHEIKPDYIVSSLREAVDILGIVIDDIVEYS